VHIGTQQAVQEPVNAVEAEGLVRFHRLPRVSGYTRVESERTDSGNLSRMNERFDRIIAAVPVGEPGRKLHKRMLANRAHLFVFMTNRDVPYTNNVSERHLRPSVIFRKVTNGFRCDWGAETYAAFRSVVSTAKANGASVLQVVQFVLSGKSPLDLVPRTG
jgi:hypothetical protein